MRGKTCTSSQIVVEKEGRETIAANQLSGDVIFGDLVWVKLHGSSWWPAQVIDGKTLSERNKSDNRSTNDIRVRLYGSYKYMYVDPVKCHLEFDNVLKENSGNHSEIFKKALKQVLSCSGSGISKREKLKSEGAIIIDNSSRKISRQKVIHKKKETDTASPRISEGLSTANSAPAQLKNKNPHKGKMEKTKNKKRKQEVVENGVEPKSSKPGSNTKRRRADAATPQSYDKKGNPLPISIGAAKNKTLMPKKRKWVNELLLQGSDAKKEKSGSLLAKLSNGRTPKAKEAEATNKLKHGGTGSATNLKGKYQLSTRRIKVMQSIGLIAPAGSPFR